MFWRSLIVLQTLDLIYTNTITDLKYIHFLLAIRLTKCFWFSQVFLVGFLKIFFKWATKTIPNPKRLATESQGKHRPEQTGS